jgi:hypothetical protein
MNIIIVKTSVPPDVQAQYDMDLRTIAGNENQRELAWALYKAGAPEGGFNPARQAPPPLYVRMAIRLTTSWDTAQVVTNLIEAAY